MSKTVAEKTHLICQSLACDRCGREVQRDEGGFEDFVTLDFDAGWSSDLGDGSHVELDLCHACVKDVLGLGSGSPSHPWLVDCGELHCSVQDTAALGAAVTTSLENG